MLCKLISKSDKTHRVWPQGPLISTKVQPKVVTSTDGKVKDVEVIETLIVQPQDDPPIAGPSKMSCTRSASVLSDPSTDGDHIESSALADVAEDDWVELVPDDQDKMSSRED